MEELINLVKTLSTKEESDLRQLKGKLSQADDMLEKNQADFDGILGILDPAVHTLAWVWLLHIRAASHKNLEPRFLLHCKLLFESGSAQQLRFVQSKACFLARRFAELAIESKFPLRAVNSLRAAIQKVSTSSEHLTPIHADFLQVCLLAKAYSAALPVLEQDILEIDPNSTGLTPQDFLRYFYYGGNIYTGLKEYKKALEMYKLALSTPAYALSAIVLESYKKFVLVSLLANGTVESLPKATSPIVQRTLKGGLPGYSEFITAFSTHDPEEVHKAANVHAETFTRDRNFGLVKQCIQSLYRRNILRHTQTYLTLSLSDISTSVKLENPAAAEKAVLRMIEEGNIFATINQRDGMVSFKEDPEQYNTNEMLTKIDRHISKSLELSNRIKTLDETISLTTHYVQRTNTQDRSTRSWNEMDELMAEKMSFNW